MAQPSDLNRLKAKIKRITHLLENRYGIPQGEKGGDPLDILIQTILSQNTNDKNRDQAYRRLKSRFPHWEDVLKANRKAVVQAIRPGGLGEQKARYIRGILFWIKRREEKLNLDFLKRMRSEKIQKTMGNLKGVGPKTVHCLLLFGMGREAFPVDTHVLRVGKRLCLIPEKFNAEKAHQWMDPLIPKGKALSLHLNLIRFGRSLCHTRNPKCLRCFLSKECLYYS